MPAYFLVDTREIKDAAKMRNTKPVSRPSSKSLAGAISSSVARLRLWREWRPVFPVLIQFPSMDEARRWYDSEDYRELKRLRLAATSSSGVFIAGL